MTMPDLIPLDASDPRSRTVVDLAGVEVGVRWYWLPRAAGWYVDLERPDGTPIATGMRLTPAAPLNAPGASPYLPDGRWVVSGPDAYGREDLGRQVQLWWYSRAELDAVSGAA
jgi:hypothetical protein